MPNIRKKARKSKRISRKGSCNAPDLEHERDRLDKKRLKRDRSKHVSYYWNVCPKCGGDMDAQAIMSVRYDTCRTCGGVYVDRDEIKFAGKYVDPARFVKSLAKKKRKLPR